MQILEKRHHPYFIPSVLAAVYFFLHLFFLGKADVINSDSVSRVFSAVHWLDHPRYIISDVWLPIHTYLNAFVIWITSEHVVTPVIFHSLLGSLLAFPVYFFSKRELNASGAWIPTTLILFNPLVFNLGFEPLSEIPAVFFAFTALNFLSKSFQSEEIKHAIIGGAIATIAAGMRYEVWILIFCFGLIGLLKKQWKMTLVFGVFASLFPLSWMVGSYIEFGHPLYGITGVFNEAEIITQNQDLPEYIMNHRYWFFPISFVLYISPLIVLLLLITFLRNIRRLIHYLPKLIWVLPSIIVFIAIYYKSIHGTVLLQNRFIILPLVFFLPITASIYITRNKVNLYIILPVVLVSTIFSKSWLYMHLESISPKGSSFETGMREYRFLSLHEFNHIPQLRIKYAHKLSEQINDNYEEGDGLFIDFVNWQFGYNLALNADKTYPKQFIATVMSFNQMNDNYSHFFINNKHGFVFLNCKSELKEYLNFQDNRFNIIQGNKTYYVYLEIIDSKDGLYLLKYKTSLIENDVVSETCDCPEKNSKEFFMMNLQQGVDGMNQMELKAHDNNISIEEMIERDAQWYVENAI